MNKLLGYIFSTIGFLGFIFFLKYKGDAIPLKEMYFVLSIFTIIVGAYFIIKYKSETKNQAKNSLSKRNQVEILKRSGEKIKITLDNCEIKSRSYEQEIMKDDLPTRIEMIDSLFDSERNYKVENFQQTYIVFYKKIGDTVHKFISQPTTRSSEILKGYIEDQKGINLYIDKNNLEIYYFELPF